MQLRFLTLIEKAAATRAEAPALADENRELTFASLKNAVLGLSARLKQAGIC